MRGLLDGSAKQQRGERRSGIVPVVVPPGVFVEVALQPFAGHAVVVSGDAVLDVPEEPFDGVRVDVPARVNALRVPDRAVRRMGLMQVAIPDPFVGVDRASGETFRLTASSAPSLGWTYARTVPPRSTIAYDPDLAGLPEVLRFALRHPASHRRLRPATVSRLVSLNRPVERR